MAEPADKRQQALTQARIIWAALVAGTLTIMVVFGVLLGTGGGEGAADEEGAIDMIFLGVAGLVLVGAIVGSTVVRKVMKPKIWANGQFQPEAFIAYQVGGIAPLEGAAVVSLVLAFADGSMLPIGAAAMIATAVLVMRCPSAADAAEPTEAMQEL